MFPSEVAAAWWRRAAAERAEGAIRSDRFVSWDRFKERTFETRREARPVNNTLRMLFAHDLLERNQTDAMLSRFISPEHRESSPAFASTVVELLPTLELLFGQVQRLPTASDAAGADRSSRALFADLRLLRDEYEAFLRRYALFEPAFLEPAECIPPGRFCLLYPEALEDYAELTAPLRRMSGVSVRSVPDHSASVTLRQFENSVQEIQSVLSEIERVLDNGTPQSEIALTVCEDDRYLTELFSRAAAREVPLQARYGRPLTEHPGGRLMLQIEELGAASFSVTELGNLLLDQGLPVRDREQAARVVAFGVKHGCIGADPPGMRGGWDRAFAATRHAGAAELGRYFRSMRGAVADIRGAANFAELRSAVNKFLAAFLDTDSWDEQGKRTLQWAQDLIGELRRIEHELGIAVGSPWRVYLRLLRTRRYVPLRRSEGIAVYQYRVSAALAPQNHFVLGVSQQAARVAIDRFGYLRADEKERLGLAERDITEQVLRLFSHSGRQVFLSFARNAFSGRRLAPPLFLRGDSVAPADHQTLQRLQSEDLYRAEREALRVGAPITRMYRLQYRGLRAALRSALGTGQRELDRAAIADEDLRARVQQRLRVDGALRLSSSHLHTYARCPLAFLIRYGLGLDQPEYRPVAEHPLQLGALYHKALERLGAAIRAADAHIRASQLSLYRRKLDQILDDITAQDLPRDTGIPAVLMPAVRLRMRRRFSVFLERLVSRFENYAIVEIESWRTAPARDPFGVNETGGDPVGADDQAGAPVAAGDGAGTTRFSGKIDLVLQRPADGATAILDYKLGAAPKKAELLALFEDRSALVPAYQMPVYAVLIAHTTPPIGEALYYSIRENRFLTAIGEGSGAWTSRARIPALAAAVCSHAARVAAHITAGRYCRTDGYAACSACDFRAVCRRKFFIQ